MIKAVLFDLYETLVTQQGIDVPRAARLGPALGLDDKAYRVEWRLQRPHIVRGDLTFGEALMAIGRRLNATIDPAIVQRVTGERVRANREVFHRIDPALVALVRELHRNGVRLGVISNCFREDVEGWPGCAFAPLFAQATFSFAVGLAKPDAEIYLHTTRALEVAPEETIFVGDAAGDELAGAESAGMRAVRVDWFVTPKNAHPAFTTVPCVSNGRDLLHLIAAG